MFGSVMGELGAKPVREGRGGGQQACEQPSGLWGLPASWGGLLGGHGSGVCSGESEISRGASSGLRGAAGFHSCIRLLVPGNQCKFRCKHIKAFKPSPCRNGSFIHAECHPSGMRYCSVQ